MSHSQAKASRLLAGTFNVCVLVHWWQNIHCHHTDRYSQQIRQNLVMDERIAHWKVKIKGCIYGFTFYSQICFEVLHSTPLHSTWSSSIYQSHTTDTSPNPTPANTRCAFQCMLLGWDPPGEHDHSRISSSSVLSSAATRPSMSRQRRTYVHAHTSTQPMSGSQDDPCLSPGNG